MTGEHILNLFLFSLFYLHTGFAEFEGKRSNCDRRWRNPTEWRTESPGQPRQVSGVSVAICPSSSAASSGPEHTDPAHKVGLCEAGFSPFPWACGRNLELLDTIVIQEMRPRQCEVSSPDVSLRFLEPCIRTQTSTSWMIRSVQWTQESAGTCLNCEFAPVFYHLCFPGTL